MNLDDIKMEDINSDAIAKVLAHGYKKSLDIIKLASEKSKKELSELPDIETADIRKLCALCHPISSYPRSYSRFPCHSNSFRLLLLSLSYADSFRTTGSRYSLHRFSLPSRYKQLPRLSQPEELL